MSWTKKINNKIYLSGLIVNLAIAWYFADGFNKEFIWLTVMITCTACSHYFNIKGMGQIVAQRVERKQGLGGGQMLTHFALKLLLLIIGLVCLMVFIPHKVPQGLILYIFQLIILALSIKNIGKFFKKGSSS